MVPMASVEHEPITEVWGQSPWSGAKPPEAVSLLAFQRPMKVTKFTPLTVSGKLSVCDVSTLNRIPSTSLRRTGGLKQLSETVHLVLDSGESSNISRISHKQ